MDYTKYMALDVGDKRIGIALTDYFKSMAFPFETYNRVSLQKDIEYILKVAKDNNVELIVCGLPYNFDGSESLQLNKTLKFIDELKSKTNLPVDSIDERFTTLSARRDLIDANVRRENRKKVIDKVAASYILEYYLQKNKK